jgi:hypothetical protein
VLGKGRLGTGEEGVLALRSMGILVFEGDACCMSIGLVDVDVSLLARLLVLMRRVSCGIIGYRKYAFDVVGDMYEFGTSASSSKCPATGDAIMGETTSSICPGLGEVIW